MRRARHHVVLDALTSYVGGLSAEASSIGYERKEDLNQLSSYIAQRLLEGQKAKLVFIDAHNATLSQMAQVWAQTTAVHHGLTRVVAFSGALHPTACSLQTVLTLQRAGFSVLPVARGAKPVYAVHFSDWFAGVMLHAKLFDAEPNPHTGFAAIFCGGMADSWQAAMGADLQLALGYRDPQHAAQTAEEGVTYDAACRRIAVELNYVMSQVAKDMAH